MTVILWIALTLWQLSFTEQSHIELFFLNQVFLRMREIESHHAARIECCPQKNLIKSPKRDGCQRYIAEAFPVPNFCRPTNGIVAWWLRKVLCGNKIISILSVSCYCKYWRLQDAVLEGASEQASEQWRSIYATTFLWD